MGGRLVVPEAELAQVEEVARLLDSVDAQHPPATPEEVDTVSRNERDRWTWIGKDELGAVLDTNVQSQRG